ncbi:hypothetical protein N0V84_000593 [Fusarium piperis]|uniref:CBM-cenC domain-containing protein n=1 Tax=Fusarium piperis TaxID=1435070 RepID=A0A9W8WN13_9HYPO|nr:hypothetical protein N0V84_000593 [Fusarium piperis]
MIFSKVFIAVTVLAVSSSVTASPCRASSRASSSALLSTSTESVSTETTVSTTGESSATATVTAATTESSTLTEPTATEDLTTELFTTTAETSTTARTSSTETFSTTIEATSTTAESSSTTAEASSSTTSICIEPTNFVQNPSFEDGPEPWRYSSSSVSRTTQGNAVGEWAVSFAFSEGNNLLYIEQDIEGLTPGLDYKLTYEWWTPYGQVPSGCYFHAEASGTAYEQDDTITEAYDFFVDAPSFTFRPASSTQIIRFGAFCPSQPDFTLYLDLATILPVQPVGSSSD